MRTSTKSAAMMIRPLTTFCIFTGTLKIVMEAPMVPMIMAPAMVPKTVPLPPEVAVPPMTVEAMPSTSSVELVLE